MITILLEIIFGVALLSLIAKALVETVWGLILIIYGIFCHVVGWILYCCSMSLGLLVRLNKAANW